MQKIIPKIENRKFRESLPAFRQLFEGTDEKYFYKKYKLKISFMNFVAPFMEIYFACALRAPAPKHPAQDR